MISLVSLLVAAALVSVQCSFEAHAQRDNSNDLDNNLLPNVVHAPRRQVRKYVRIEQPPPPAVEAAPGERILLQCVVFGAPSPSVTWMRNGQAMADLEEDSNEILTPHPSSIASLTAKLVTVPSNGDVYACVATAGVHQQIAYTTVYIVGDDSSNLLTLGKLFQMPTKPVITTSFNDVIQELGTDLVLPCRAHSHTKYQVEWQDNNGTVAYENHKLRVLPSGDLLLLDLVFDYMGSYTCVVKNAYGEDTASTFLYPCKP